MKKRRIRIHKQTLKQMNNPEYIYIWVNPDDLSIAICSCESSNKDAIKVSFKRECELYSAGLFKELKSSDKVNFEERTYSLNGVISQGKKVAKFNILENLKV